jgi:leucyl-tRNA synthetase
LRPREELALQHERAERLAEAAPLLHLDDGTTIAVEDSELPVELPFMEDFKPSPDGSAPLARAKQWIKTTRSGRAASRNTDTMPGWAGSCWYWLRFMDPTNEREPWSKAAESYWGPVDLYVGGASHALIIRSTRFWHCDIVRPASSNVIIRRRAVSSLVERAPV